MTIWTRTFVLATVVNLLVSLVFFMLMVVMAAYAADRFAAAEAMAGLAASVFIVGALSVRPFAGRFLDVLGRKRMLLVGLATFGVASILYVPVDSLALLLAVRLLHGAGLGIAHTSISTSVMMLLPPGRRAEGMGWFTLSGTVATAVGPLVALSVVASYDMRTLFLVGAALSTAAFLLALALRLPGPMRTGRPRPGRAFRARVGDFVARPVLPIGAMMLLVGVAFSGVLTFVATHAAAIDLAGAVGGFFIAYSVVILVSRPIVGRIQDTRGDNVIIYPALALLASGLVVLALAASGAALLLAGSLLGLGIGTLQSSTHVIAVSAVPAERAGVATSTLFILLDLGVGLGPLALGAVIGRWGYPAMYLGLAVLVVAAAAVYRFGHGRHGGAVMAVTPGPSPAPCAA